MAKSRNIERKLNLEKENIKLERVKRPITKKPTSKITLSKFNKARVNLLTRSIERSYITKTIPDLKSESLNLESRINFLREKLSKKQTGFFGQNARKYSSELKESILKLKILESVLSSKMKKPMQMELPEIGPREAVKKTSKPRKKREMPKGTQLELFKKPKIITKDPRQLELPLEFGKEESKQEVGKKPKQLELKLKTKSENEFKTTFDLYSKYLKKKGFDSKKQQQMLDFFVKQYKTNPERAIKLVKEVLNKERAIVKQSQTSKVNEITDLIKIMTRSLKINERELDLKIVKIKKYLERQSPEVQEMLTKLLLRLKKERLSSETINNILNNFTQENIFQQVFNTNINVFFSNSSFSEKRETLISIVESIKETNSNPNLESKLNDILKEIREIKSNQKENQENLMKGFLRVFSNISELRRMITPERLKTIFKEINYFNNKELLRMAEETFNVKFTEISQKLDTQKELQERLERILIEESQKNNVSRETIEIIYENLNSTFELLLSEHDYHIEILNKLKEIKNTQINESTFKKILKEVLDESFKREKTELVKELLDKLDPEFQYIDNLMQDLMKELKSTSKGIGHGIGKTIGEIRKLKDYMSSEKYKKFIKEAIKESFIENNSEIVKVIIAEFSKEFPELKDLGTKLDSINEAIKEAMKELKSTSKGIGHGIGKTIGEIRKLREDIINMYLDLNENVNTFKTETFDKLKEISDRLTPDGFKAIFGTELERIINEAIEKGNTDLFAKIQNAFGEEFFENFAKKEDLEDLKNYMDEHHNELLEAIEELKKEKEEKKEPDEDPEKKKKKEEEDEDPEKKKKKEEEEKKKKRAERRKSIAANGWAISGLLAIIAAIVLLVYAIGKANQAAPVITGGTIPVNPVIPAAAQAIVAKGSLLGSLGGINPLIIIALVVVLFLLFPKK